MQNHNAPGFQTEGECTAVGVSMGQPLPDGSVGYVPGTYGFQQLSIIGCCPPAQSYQFPVQPLLSPPSAGFNFMGPTNPNQPTFITSPTVMCNNYTGQSFPMPMQLMFAPHSMTMPGVGTIQASPRTVHAQASQGTMAIQAQIPQGAMQYPPGAMQYPPRAIPSGAMQYPPGAIPPGAMQYPPGATQCQYPPGVMQCQYPLWAIQCHYPPAMQVPTETMESPPGEGQAPAGEIQSPPGTIQCHYPPAEQAPIETMESPPEEGQAPAGEIQSPPGTVQGPPGTSQSPSEAIQSPPEMMQTQPMAVQAPPGSMQVPPLAMLSAPTTMLAPPGKIPVGATCNNNGKPTRFCRFCKSNNETAECYLNHNLIENGKIQCPILREHICEYCGCTGDNAHTKKYCPVLNSASTAEKGASDKKTGGNKNKKRRPRYITGRSAAGGYSMSKF